MLAEMESYWRHMVIPAAIFTVLCVCYIAYRYAYEPYQLLGQYGIKGPKPSIFYGNYKRLSKLGLLEFYDELYRSYGPVVGFYIGCQPCVMVADPDILKQIMGKEHESFLHRPVLITKCLDSAACVPTNRFVAKGEDWKRRRRIVAPSFSATRTKEAFIAFSRKPREISLGTRLVMAPRVEKICETLVEKFGESASSSKSVNVLELYVLFAMENILACGFGRLINVLRGEADQLSEAASVSFAAAQDTQDLSMNRVDLILSNFPFLQPLIVHLLSRSPAGKSLITMKEIVISMINARRKSDNPGQYKDILQRMIDACTEEDGTPRKLTDSEIVALSITFLLTGTETTSYTLAYTSYLLALHPSVQDQLHSEIEEYFEENAEATLYDATLEVKYLDMVINESLRLYPPGPRIWRGCLKTTEINGVTIPKGAIVHIPIYLLQHNPEYWPDPERFDPERFTPGENHPNLSHMPFGWGPLICIGMRFALMETKMALIKVLRKYKFVRAPDTEVPLEMVVGITLAAKNGIHLKIIHRD